MNKNLNSDKKVELRPIRFSDAQFLMELNNNDEIAKYVVGTPRKVTLEEQKKWMELLKEEKGTVRFVVECNHTSIGTVIISDISYTNLTANVNIKLHPSVWGEGYGKKSVNLAVSYCFSKLRLKCLTAHVLSYNNASLTLFERCGFRREGLLRSRIVKNGDREDLVSFSILETDYNK